MMFAMNELWEMLKWWFVFGGIIAGLLMTVILLFLAFVGVVKMIADAFGGRRDE